MSEQTWLRTCRIIIEVFREGKEIDKKIGAGFDKDEMKLIYKIREDERLFLLDSLQDKFDSDKRCIDFVQEYKKETGNA